MTTFNIDFVSDMEHEHLMAEVSFGGQRLCIIDKENGNDQMRIEFLVDLYVLPESVEMKFSLDEFIKTLDTAKTELKNCA
ncbi:MULTISPECIES: hypothetical protein [Burkholderia]|nr:MULTISPECIES: hypothetical protein [Burkholderia]